MEFSKTRQTDTLNDDTQLLKFFQPTIKLTGLNTIIKLQDLIEPPSDIVLNIWETFLHTTYKHRIFEYVDCCRL